MSMKTQGIILAGLLSCSGLLFPPVTAGEPLRLAGFFLAQPVSTAKTTNARTTRSSQEAPPTVTIHPARPPAPVQAPQLENLIDEFMATSKQIKNQPGVDEPVKFSGPAQRPNWFQVLQVTTNDNPLMTEKCKRQAMHFSIEQLRKTMGLENDAMAMRAAAEHMQHHRDFILNNHVSYSDYLRELAECRAFCAPLVAHLANCHILSVARRPHGVVLFPFNSASLDRRYTGDQGLLTMVKRQLDDNPTSKVALIGRSSRIGSLKYNRRLAGQRTLAVRDALVSAQVPPDRIEAMWFGWEPPQITTQVASEYGMKQLLNEKGAAAINQSVVMVIY